MSKNAKINDDSENNGLQLGRSLRDGAPPEFGNGLHLGQWLRGEGGLHLGQTMRGPEPQELIINGDFNDPGVGSWSEDVVAGWYVPTDGAFQNVVIGAGLYGSPELYLAIVNSEADPSSPPGFPPRVFGEIAQDVEAATGEAYTLRFDAWFDYAQLGPHVNGVQGLWNGQPLTATEVGRSSEGPAFWASYEATVIGEPGTDTLTFRSELFTSGPGSRVDHVSLVGPNDAAASGWFA